MSRDFVLRYYRPVGSLVSRRGDAVKYVFRTWDGIDIENVILSDHEGRTSFCISSQIGCPVGCIYCATGLIGFLRNLRAGEIVNEVVSLEKLSKKPDSILFMGMGEPLLNYGEVVKAVSLLNRIGFGPRKITISTFGVPQKIRKLATSGLRPRLAVSIGSPFEEKRRRIIPFARHHTLAQLKEALHHYQRKTRRRITLEYTLIGGMNDSPEEASELARIAKELGAHVNIIRYNPLPCSIIEGRGFSASFSTGHFAGEDSKISLPTFPSAGEGYENRRKVFSIAVCAVPDPRKVEQFRGILEEDGIRVTERFRRGADIGAACGQLVYSRKYRFS